MGDVYNKENVALLISDKIVLVKIEAWLVQNILVPEVGQQITPAYNSS